MMRAYAPETQAWPRSRLALLALVPLVTCLSTVSPAQSPEAPSAAAPTTAAPAEPAPSTAPVAAPAVGAPAIGVGPTGSFAGLSKNSDQPIDIESDVLLVHDSQKTATFKGNVKAVQGSTILHSNELEVHYAGGGGESLTAAPGAKPNTVASTDPAAGAPQAATPPAAADKSGVALGDNGTKITRILAKGQVVINSDQDQTTTGDLADYDVPAQTVVVSGNVVLTQGQNVLKGDRLFINLATGESRFDPGNTSGKPARIKALFRKPGSDDDASKEKADEKTGNATPGDGSATSGAEPETAETASQGQPAPEQRTVKEAPAKPAPAQDDASPWQLVPGNMQ
ncbi:MAG TPA: LptA/OstA family protein [Methyloceanibacter sp.]